MDWFGLNDPFTQQVPLKITNAYSGTLWFQSQLVSPRSGYYNYSGISLGAVNSGASTTLVATWDAGVSGWITGSSPITDTLTLNLTTFTSSNYTGSYSSGNFTVFNTLFNRYSGVIKVFGDIYNNDQPAPSTSQVAGGTMNNSGVYSYAISYILSGWESDVGAATAITLNSGFGSVSVSWSVIAGAAQYFVWRWSGAGSTSGDYTLYSGTSPPNGGLLRSMDLMAVTTVGSFSDTGGAALQSGLFRHRTWQQFRGIGVADGGLASADAAIYLTSPQSRTWAANPAARETHGYHIGKNASGTNLLGPFYMVVHIRSASIGGGTAILLNTSVDGSSSGTSIADVSALNNQLSGVWYRHTILLGASGSISASGTVHFQFLNANVTQHYDDAFVVAVS